MPWRYPRKFRSTCRRAQPLRGNKPTPPLRGDWISQGRSGATHRQRLRLFCVALRSCGGSMARSTRVHRRSSSARSSGAGTRRSSNRRALRQTATERFGVPVPSGWSSTTLTFPMQRSGFCASSYSFRCAGAVEQRRRSSSPRRHSALEPVLHSSTRARKRPGGARQHVQLFLPPPHWGDWI